MKHLSEAHGILFTPQFDQYISDAHRVKASYLKQMRLGREEEHERKRAGGPDIRVPIFWTRNIREGIIAAGPNSVSQNYGTLKHRKTVESAVRESVSEYFGSRKLHNNMSRQGPVAVGIHR